MRRLHRWSSNRLYCAEAILAVGQPTRARAPPFSFRRGEHEAPCPAVKRQRSIQPVRLGAVSRGGGLVGCKRDRAPFGLGFSLQLQNMRS